MNFINTYFDEVAKIIKSLDFKKIERLAEEINKIREKNGRIFFLGVGGSSGNASHAVNDFRKLCDIECYAPTDNVSELTARTNDEGWNTVFSEWLKVSQVSENDAIFIFSVGGGNKEKKISVNLINAIDYCIKSRCKIFGIVGKKDGYTFQKADLCVLIPNENDLRVTPHSEEFQTIIWHCLISHPLLQKNQTKW